MRHGLFTKELDGTLHICTADDRTYEVRRTHISSTLIVIPDYNVPPCSREEQNYFKQLFRESGCYTR